MASESMTLTGLFLAGVVSLLWTGAFWYRRKSTKYPLDGPQLFSFWFLTFCALMVVFMGTLAVAFRP
jgi:hypothetical protein